MNSIISFQRHTAWRKNVMEKMDVKRGAQALDVCAGTGDWSISLAEEIGPEGKVIGLDFSDNMLMVANQKIKQHRSEEHTSELQSRGHLVCRLLLEKKNKRQAQCT